MPAKITAPETPTMSGERSRRRTTWLRSSRVKSIGGTQEPSAYSPPSVKTSTAMKPQGIVASTTSFAVRSHPG